MKKILTLFSALIIAASCLAQYDDESIDISKQTFTQRLIFGGGFGLQFGDYTYIDVSPTIGYKLTDRLVPGVSITYKYINYKFYNYETDIYGGSVFLRYYVIPQIFLHGEYEILSFKAWDNNLLGPKRVELHSIFGGAGYRQRLGNRSYLNFLILYNFNEERYSIYQNPIIRLSFDIGL